MGVKTGKRWYRVSLPKKSVCVESRPHIDHERCNRIRFGCGPKYTIFEYMRFNNPCDPEVPAKPAYDMTQAYKLLSKRKPNAPPKNRP